MATRQHRPAWSGRPIRVVTAGAAAALLAVLAAAGTPGAPRGAQPAAGPAASATTPGRSPPADPLAAPSTGEPDATPEPNAAPDPNAAPQPNPAPAPNANVAEGGSDPLAEAAARARRITDTAGHWASFTLGDRKAGRLVGDTRTHQVTNSESVVKAWLAADLLATATAQKRRLTAYERARLTAMIRVSDDDAAEVIYQQLGSDASIRRMIRTCRMTDTRVYPSRWSLTQISSRDMVRLGACLAPGPGKPLTRSASQQLLTLMRTVTPSNAFGIPAAQPAGRGVRIAVKNGWTQHGGTGLWNVNCLGIWGPELRWVLAVTQRFPAERPMEYGADFCRRVAAELFPRTPG
jgi:hypothetical protein